MADNNKIKKSAQDYYSNYYKNKPASPASSNNISQAAQNYYSSYYKNQQSGRSGYLSQNSNRYQARYNDMLQDPRKYYDAYGGNVSKYKSELSYYEFMTSLAQHDLPDQYIQNTMRYDDMRRNPQKYIQAYGGNERTYYSELNKYKELYGIEKTTASHVMSLMDKSGVQGWSSIVKSTPELLNFYDYDPTNPDDEYLRAVDYAPSSFLTAAQLDKKLKSGYSADYYTKFDTSMGEAVDNTTAPKVFKNTLKDITPTPSFYLQQLYKYDMSDPDDVINKALGLMPNSFKYENTDDDIARKNKGLLPKYAEDYVKNSMRFNIEYSTYAQMMQQYANDLYEWKHGKNTGFLGIFKGEKPTMPEAPETVQAIMEYKDLLTAPTELQTPYEKYTEDATKAPDEPMFYFGDIDTLPLYVDEDMLDTNEPGYFQAEKDIARPGGIYEEIMSHQFDTGGIVGYIGKMVETGRLTQEQANELWKTNTGEAMARAAAEIVYENETIQELKDAGVYEDVLAESNRIYQDVQAALTGEYSPDKANTLKTNIDVVGQFIDMPVDWGGAIEYGTAGIANEIAAKLRELGWKGEKYSSNPEIQSLLDEAAYTAIKGEYDYRQVTLDNMKNSPAWLIAIYDGMHSGVTNVRDNLLGLTLEIGKLNPFQPEESRSYLDKIAKGVAQSGQYRRAAYQEDLETAQGGATWGTNALFNITSTATELGLELAAGRWIGSYGASAATAAEAATRWRGLAKKLLLNKELVPYFMSSLGSSLMQGEIKGYNGLQNWLVALPTAYFEAKTESMFGFFSKSGSAYKLFKNGISSLPVETLKNFGRVLSENTLGETFEEVIQDVFGSTYEQIVTGQGDPINLGDTITTTLGVGVLMTLFGLPSGLKSYASAKTVESSFNEAINAYESGDISAYNKAIEKMKLALGQALTNLTEDFRTGEIDRQAELLNIDEALSTNLNKMDSAIRDALNLRQLKEDGQDVPENLISLMDARVNNAIGTLKSMQGVETQPETLYDQIMNSEELTRMATGKGFTAELIGQSKAPLTNAQVQVLRDIEQVSETNPYVNVQFSDTASVEELQSDVVKSREDMSIAEAEYKSLLKQVETRIREAYAKGAEEGKAAYNAIIESGVKDELAALKKAYEKKQRKYNDRTAILNAFNAQGGFRKMFEQAANLGQGVQAPVSPVEGDIAADVQIPYETATTQGSPVAQGKYEGVARSIPFEGSVAEIVGQASLSESVKVTTTPDGEPKAAKVLSDVKREKPSLKETAKEEYNKVRRQMVDTGADIMDIGNATGDELLYPLYNHAKQSIYEAQAMIGIEQRDINNNVVGKSLLDIYKPIYAKGTEYRVLADTYVYHLHNIDRMSLVERGLGEKNKPVFGESVTAEVSRQTVAKIEAEHPELKQFANELIGYHRNLLKRELDSSKISQETYDKLITMYPHYVPTDRFLPKTSGMVVLGRAITIADTIRTAKGGDLDLLPLDESSARKTIKVIRAVNENILANRLYNNAVNNPEKTAKYIGDVVVEKNDYDIDEEEKAPLPNTLTIYRNGEKATMRVSEGVAFAFKEMQSHAETFKLADAINTLFKKAITAYNPLFWIKNLVKDLPDAVFNTKNPLLTFIKNIPIAIKEMLTNGEGWRLYRTTGAISSSFYDYKKGINTGRSIKDLIKKQTLDRVESLSLALEQLPRFTEFLATIERGGRTYENIIRAAYNAAEITGNFGRWGKLGRTLNRAFVPFFNPSVQGASRLIRRFTEAKGVKDWTSIVIRAVALGMLPSLINDLLYSGDDEYEKINNRDKDRYYLFKMSDGYWAKIPKARVLSMFGGIANRVTGEYDDADVAGFIQLAGEQVAPINPLESNIYSPILQTMFNTTWYGTPIESKRLQKYAPGQRFDSDTTSFAKWLGSITNWSPKKIDYLIDAYTGVIGDIMMPLMTPAAERGGVLAPAVNAFVLDVATTNKLATEFYDKVKDIEYRTNSEDPKTATKAKAENKVIQKYVERVSELYKLIRKAESSNKPDDEKLKIVRDLSVTISALQQEALKRLER